MNVHQTMLRVWSRRAAGVIGALMLVFATYSLWTAHAKVPIAVPAPDYWPTDGWRESTPEKQGVDSAKLADIFDYIAKNRPDIHSLLIIRNGYVILDATFYPYDGVHPHDLASCTKSVTTTLIGAAIQEGAIKSVDDPVLPYFPDAKVANLDDRKQSMAVKDLLTMRGGMECVYQGGEPTLRDMRASSNWAQFMLDRPMAARPGDKFVYCSGGMHLLAALLARATRTTPSAFARQTLFQPLGIHDFVWPSDPQGVSFGWGDLHLMPRDMAKIGFLYLHDGVWDGRRILPAGFVATARQPLAKTGVGSRYGYGWWVSTDDKEGDFEAAGRGGQRISVVPRFNAIVVFTGGGDFDPENVGKLLGPALVSDHALPENPAAIERLKAAIAQAALPPANGSTHELPEIANAISGKTYKLASNPIGLQTVALQFRSPTEASIRLTFADARDETHSIGMDGGLKISANGQYGLPVGVRGQWESPVTLALDYNTIANINRYALRLTFEGMHLRMEAREQGSSVPLVIEGSQVEPASVVGK